MSLTTMLEKYVGPFRASLFAVLRYAADVRSKMNATIAVEGPNPNV